MTADQFRRIALSFAQATEHSHMSHPDFRAGGRIFATLGYPDEDWGMVKLTPEEQNNFVKAQPDVFVPVPGGWGRLGATSVRLKGARGPSVRRAMKVAWAHSLARKAKGKSIGKATTSRQ
ncbi:MAG TPA: MmcQ/YjbR family DNA-binding protein [Bryobacteraceae bacterium]|nr:MmcQ/YjbR family DNA-binding protein [Bryobacteraceae bacterium]